MPIYMDRHDGENLTPEAVVESHAADIKLQDKYNCKFITYRYDDERDSVFCLVDAPDKSTVHKVYSEAHGFPHIEIMEVDQEIVKAFLGRVKDPSPVAGEVSVDSPFRAIMFTDLEGSTQMISEFGDEKSMDLRIGISAGEPVRNDNQLYGAAVNLAARLCSQAKPGSILVAQVVRDLTVGKSNPYTDLGEFEAKGFEGPVPMIEVAWRDT